MLKIRNLTYADLQSPSPLVLGKCTKQVFHYLCFIVVQGLAAGKAEFLVEGATHKMPSGKLILQWVWGNADVAFKIKLFVHNWRLKNCSLWLTTLVRVIHCREPILLHLHSTHVGQCRFVCCGVPRGSQVKGVGVASRRSKEIPEWVINQVDFVSLFSQICLVFLTHTLAAFLASWWRKLLCISQGKFARTNLNN